MKRWSLLVIVGLLLFSLACLGGGGKVTETPAATQEQGGAATQEQPVVTEEATTQPAGEEESAPELDPNALEGLNSYRSRVTIRTDYEDGKFSEISMEQSETREPRAQHMSMTMAGEGVEQTSTMEMIQIGDTQWINFGEGGWMQSQQSPDATPEAFGGGFTSFSDMASSMDKEDYEYIGKETVNGMKTRHYRLKISPTEAALMSMGATDVKDVKADVWITDQSDLPEFAVKFVLIVQGTFKENDQERPGTATITQEVYDVNASFTIEPPEGAENAGLPEDIPAYEGATDLFSMPGMTSFKSADDMAKISQFYQDELPGNGWTQKEISDLGTMVMQTWEKDDRTLQIMISPEDAGGCSVILTEQKPQ